MAEYYLNVLVYVGLASASAVGKVAMEGGSGADAVPEVSGAETVPGGIGAVGWPADGDCPAVRIAFAWDFWEILFVEFVAAGAI
jgi:hypothetical protein